MPSRSRAAVALALFTGAVLLVAVVVGVVESSMARLRLTQVPNLLVAATLLSPSASSSW